MRQLLFLFTCVQFITNIEHVMGGVQLRRKITQGGISHIRVQNYTDELIRFLDVTGHETELGLNILMIADYSLYQGFLDVTRGDSRTAQFYVTDYLSAVFDQMKTIYDKIKFSSEILQLNLSGTFTTMREEDCPILYEEENETDLDSNTTGNSTFQHLEDYNSTDLSLSIRSQIAVEKLTSWLKRFGTYLPEHDHAILITKFDLLSPRGDSATQGMAYVGEICRTGESSSVVEDIGAAATALIAAHELGHSLGAFHDGTNNSTLECDSRNNYLMATTVSGSENDVLFANSRIMSSCSIRSIEKKIREPSARCVWKPKSSRKPSSSSDLFVKKPGERFSLHQQCQISFGPHYGVCHSQAYYRNIPVCRRVWCKNRLEKRTAPCETRTYLPAFDGTECGKYSWCIAGECVPNEKKLMDCRDLNAKTCSKYTKVKLRHYCKSKEFNAICCMSCMKYNKKS